MSEFVNRQFETRESYEIDNYVERATKVLPARDETKERTDFAWVTFNTNPDERLLLQLGIGTNERAQGSWLYASEQLANPKDDYVNITKYIVHVEHRLFLIKNERVAVTGASAARNESTDLIQMELSLGMYVPAPTDWDRLGWIIDQAHEFNLRKKGAEIAQLGKSIQNLLENTEELS